MTKTTLMMCSLLAAGCVTDMEDDLSTIESLQRTAIDDPCLSEAADRTLGVSGNYLGYVQATSTAFVTQGACANFVAEWKSAPTPTLPLPELHTFVTWSNSAASTQANCEAMTSDARVYKRVQHGPQPWQFVGEVHRYGVWSNGTCTPTFANSSKQEDILVASSTLGIEVRIVANVSRGRSRLAPTVILDEQLLDKNPNLQYVDFSPDDPCLTDAADATFSPSGPILGYAAPSGPPYFGWLSSGVCDGFIADWTRSPTPTAPFTPDTYVQTRTGSASEENCSFVRVRERVYSKNGATTEWKYVGEAFRVGTWSGSACLLQLDAASTQVMVPGGQGTRRTRVVGMVYAGNGIGAPQMWLDETPWAED